MNSRQEFDDQLRDWADLGDERLPSRYLEAALAQVETTRQRGAGWWPLEGFLMRFQHLAPILGASAIVIAIMVFGILVGPGSVGPGVDASPQGASPTAHPTDMARPFIVPDLQEILLTEARVPNGWSLDNSFQGRTSLLVYPTRSDEAGQQAMAELDAFVGGLATEFTGESDAVYICWGAVFRTEADAARATDIYTADFTSPQGWGLTTESTWGPQGLEGAVYEGATNRFLSGAPSEDTVPAHIRLWRINNLVLALAAFFEYDASGSLHMLGDNMTARAREISGRTLP